LVAAAAAGAAAAGAAAAEDAAGAAAEDAAVAAPTLVAAAAAAAGFAPTPTNCKAPILPNKNFIKRASTTILYLLAGTRENPDKAAAGRRAGSFH
jgi:hypothetical protein